MPAKPGSALMRSILAQMLEEGGVCRCGAISQVSRAVVKHAKSLG